MDENTPATPDASAVAALRAEVDRWRSLAGQHEASYTEARDELEALRNAATGHDQALEAARVETRQAFAAEFAPRLAGAELRAQAAAAGVTLPALDYLNVGRFVGDDGTVNADEITAFVSSLPGSSPRQEYAQGLGLGRQGGAGVPQLTREDMARMTPAQIVAANREGQFDALQRGEL
ncbi:hypothetical protein ACH427_03235 [Streptomyces sp. NPDC020379]|uniref:hypothetical protein n=1 Tax=Streptomyces sp. NPDC020379 TaxID=3365071 RepID=UPI0037BB236C